MNTYLHYSKILIVFALIITVLSCEQIDVPGPVKEDPVFEVSFQDNDSKINLGGTDTELVTKVQWDDLNIRTFEGALVNTKDQSSLIIRLRDNRVTHPNTVNDTMLLFSTGSFSFSNRERNAGTQSVLLHQLYDLSFADRASWKDAIVPDSVPGGFFKMYNINPDQFATVCMNIEDNNSNCDITYCKLLKYNEGDIPLQGFSVEDNTLTPIIESSFTGEIQFLWNGVESESFSVTKKGLVSFDAIYDKGSDGEDQTIQSVEMYINIDNEGNVIPPCFTGFKTEFFEFERAPDFSAVEVVWIDEFGTEYSSANFTQTDIAAFNITAISPFPIRNQDGHRVQKVDVEFSCTLKADNGELITINNGLGTIGFSYF